LSSLELEQSKNEKKLFEALDILTIEDPSFLYEQESNTGQLVLKGLGELHLQIMRDRLSNEFGVPCSLSKLRVAYKEAAFGLSELIEVFISKIKGNQEFFELEGSVDSSVSYHISQDKANSENIKEGELRFVC
jgi:elongation factor G